MTVVQPGFEDLTGEAVGDWMPTRYTPSLTGTEEFRTDGDRLLKYADRWWSIPETVKLLLDLWQRWLIRHVLEVYPDDWPVAHLRGQLRYRQVVISMGRQNGKSLLASLFVFYFLCFHVRGPRIIGLASKDGQAKIVYDRVKYGIDKSTALSHEIKTTGTRGITRRDGTGLYQTLPAKEESAQGEPMSGGIYDELHIGLAALWDALVLAMRARRNALLIGITTAGDDSSLLLQRLYAEGAAAIEGADERFGFFCWEADSDELTEAGVIAANPAVACGRVPLDITMHDARKMWADHRRGPDGLTGRQRVIRYTLNRFIAGAGDTWASLTAWAAQAVTNITHDTDAVIYAVERTISWEAASITATSRRADGTYGTELVATINDPSQQQLADACRLLAAREGQTAVFAMAARTMGALAADLKDQGVEVWKLGDTEVQAAAQTAHGLIARQVVQHPDDQLLKLQNVAARRREVGDSWRLSRSKSLGDIDAVLATTYGLYVADVRPDLGIQLY